MKHYRSAITKVQSLVIIAVLIVVIIGAATYYTTLPPVTTTTTTSPTTALTGTTTGAVVTKEEIKVGQVEGFADHDPGGIYPPADMDTMGHLYDRLVWVHPPGWTDPAPMLATSWEISPDGMTYTFHLRKDVKFHHTGNPFTAEAVKFSFERQMAMNNMPWLLNSFTSPELLRVVDDYTFEMKLSVLYVPPVIWGALGDVRAGAILDPVVKDHDSSGTYGKGDYGNTWLQDTDAGTGPYILDKWVRGVSLSMVANPDYFMGAPKIKRITFMEIKDPVAQQMALQRGDIDVMKDVTPEIRKALAADPNIVMDPQPSLMIEALAFRLKPGSPLTDVRVRQAIRYAFDYTGLPKIMGGTGSVIGGQIVPGLVGWDPQLNKTLVEKWYGQGRPEDLDKAKKLLADAGYPDGFTMRVAAPQRLRIGLMDNDVVLYFQAQMRKVGISVELTIVNAGAPWYALYRIPWNDSRAYDAAIMGDVYDYGDPDNLYAWNTWSPGDYAKLVGWSGMDPELDRMIVEARTELNVARRAELYHAIEERFTPESYMMYLYYYKPVLPTWYYVKGAEYNAACGGWDFRQAYIAPS